MKLRKINESFKILAESLLKESANRNELQIALTNTVDQLMSRGATIKEFEIAFQDVIEQFHPDKCWWEVCDLNIFWDLMESRDPEETIQHILNSIKNEEQLEEDGYNYKGYMIVDDPKAGNWFVKDQQGSFSTDTEAEVFVDSLVDEQLSESKHDDNDYVSRKRAQFLLKQSQKD